MKSKRAFTVIELLIVITIIGILMGLVIATVQPIQQRSRDAKRKSDINLMLAALNQFHLDYKIYPNYTYLLGHTTDPNANESYLDLGADLSRCANFGADAPGHPSRFTKLATDLVGSPTTPPVNFTATDFNNYILRPGFVSVNHFLICLGYIDRLITDPRALGNFHDYRYQVSFDYQHILLSSRVENANDPASIERLLLNGMIMNPRRYFEGNGRFVWQFDEASNGSEDGRYFYQCLNDNNGILISRDNRSLSRFQPFTTNLTTLNTNCQQVAPNEGVHVPTN